MTRPIWWMRGRVRRAAAHDAGVKGLAVSNLRYSGDAVPSESLVEMSKGCDVLIHEVYSQKGFDKREPAWQRYHADSHTSSRELADIATRAKPKLLIIYHHLFWGTTEEELLAEIRAHYTGRVISGKDLEVY